MSTLTPTKARGILQVRLPWPARELSQNARGHWSERKDATADARAVAFIYAKNALPAEAVPVTPGAPLRVEFVFHRGTRHRHDLLNLAARMKAAVDGIADALGVDDVTIAESSQAWGDPVKGGAVTVTVMELQHGTQE